MDTLKQAADLLADAERSLRGLIEGCLRSESYGSIAELARLAEGVSQLRRTVSAGDPGEGNSDRAAGDDTSSIAAPTNGTGRTRGQLKPRAGEYPQFQRDSDKLVKLGWSDRDRQVYEHRAPKSAVLRICDEIGKRTKRFRMEDILADLGTGREPVPTYQAYLTLAWLRSIRAVDRDGKDGYRVRTSPLSTDRVRALWDAVEERA